MMRLGRRASLLVAAYLLTSAATAYAECAWVLWEYRQDLPQNQPPMIEWMIVRAFKSEPDCRSLTKTKLDHEEAVTRKMQVGLVVRGLDDDSIRADLKLPDGRSILRLYRAMCLPSNLDPRGPKEK
jgi:hypothetical protein